MEDENPGKPDEKSEPKPKPTTQEDNGGLLSALQKERDARKEFEKSNKDLQGELDTIKKSFAASETMIEQITGKLKVFELREAKDTAINQAISKLDEEHTVDREKVQKLAEKLGSEDLESNISEIVSILKAPKVEVRKERITTGQPAKTEPEIDFKKTNLGQLYRENPEAYAAYVADQRSKNKFFNK